MAHSTSTVNINHEVGHAVKGGCAAGYKNPGIFHHRAYIPNEIADEGFVGDLDAYASAKTVTLVHPLASLQEVERSLEIVLQDIRLRMGSDRPRRLERRDEEGKVGKRLNAGLRKC